MKHTDIRLSEDELWTIYLLVRTRKAEAAYEYEKFGQRSFKQEEKFLAQLEKKLGNDIDTLQKEVELDERKRVSEFISKLDK